MNNELEPLTQQDATRLPDWGDTSLVRFMLWAVFSFVTTAVVTLFLLLFNASRRRQRRLRQQRAQKKRSARDLRRWHNRRASYEKTQRRDLEITLRQERQTAEAAVRHQIAQTYDLHKN